MEVLNGTQKNKGENVSFIKHMIRRARDRHGLPVHRVPKDHDGQKRATRKTFIGKVLATWDAGGSEGQLDNRRQDPCGCLASSGWWGNERQGEGLPLAQEVIDEIRETGWARGTERFPVR